MPQISINAFDLVKTILDVVVHYRGIRNSIANDQVLVSVFAFLTKAFMVIVDHILIKAHALEPKQ